MLLGGGCAAARLPRPRPTQQPCRASADASDAAPRRAFRLLLSYDGGAYAGFQLQPVQQGDSVQRRLESALGRLLNEPRAALSLACAARTDAGVHAAGQVVSFTAAREPRRGAAGLVLSLNGLLPDDCRVLACADAAPGFSARFDALGKRYTYALDNAAVADPLRRRYAAHHFRPLDVDAMRAAAAHFVGTHDFSAFANMATVEACARAAAWRSSSAALVTACADVSSLVASAARAGALRAPLRRAGAGRAAAARGGGGHRLPLPPGARTAAF